MSSTKRERCSHVGRWVFAALALAWACSHRTVDPPRSAQPHETCASHDRPRVAASSFELHILRGTWDALGLGYEASHSQPKLERLWTSTKETTLTEADVESFAWDDQRVTLTERASQEFIRAYAADASDSGLSVLDHRAFVVATGGRFRFGGVVLHPESPMGISYPVLNCAWEGERVVVVVRSSVTTSGAGGLLEVDPAYCEVAELFERRDTLER